MNNGRNMMTGSSHPYYLTNDHPSVNDDMHQCEYRFRPIDHSRTGWRCLFPRNRNKLRGHYYCDVHYYQLLWGN